MHAASQSGASRRSRALPTPPSSLSKSSGNSASKHVRIVLPLSPPPDAPSMNVREDPSTPDQSKRSQEGKRVVTPTEATSRVFPSASKWERDDLRALLVRFLRNEDVDLAMLDYDIQGEWDSQQIQSTLSLSVS